jgi:hypothetical protein
LPETPVTVTVDAFAGAELVAERVIVLPPDAPAGVNAAVTPGGNPEAAMLTLPVNPPRGNTPIAVEAL